MIYPEELSSEELHQLHVEMWGWLGEEDGRDKHKWPRWKSNGGDVCDVYTFCFACTDAKLASGRAASPCYKCPIKWTGGDDCLTFGSEYRDWKRSNHPASIALTIAGLPWKDKR